MIQDPPPTLGPGPNVRALRLLGWSAAFAALVSLTILAIRVESIARHGALFETTGEEGTVYYGVWKARFGHPLYEAPNAGHYSTTFYNAGFYRVYGAVLGLIGADHAGSLFAGRLLTTAFALAGATAMFFLMRNLTGARGSGLVFPAAVALLTWFGYSSTGWWMLTVRPDGLALALATLGLALGVWGLRASSPAPMLAAATAFLMAWGIKQSTVSLLGGLCVAGVLIGQWRRTVFTLALPCAGVMALCLWIGGPTFRYHLLSLAAASRIIPADSLDLTLRVLPANPWLWLTPLLALAELRRQGWSGWRSDPVTPVVVAAVLATTWGAISCGREGSNKNQFFEGMVASAIATAVLVHRRLVADIPPVWSTGSRRWLAPALVLMTAVLPLSLLLGVRAGHLRLVPEAEYAAKAEQARAIADLPRPVFVRDPMLALPHWTTDEAFPAFVIDWHLYPIAERAGLVRGGGITGLVRARRFGSLMLQPGDPLEPVADEAGYARAGHPMAWVRERPDGPGVLISGR